MSKRQLWEEIIKYNDEFSWAMARGMTLFSLRQYLAMFKRVEPELDKLAAEIGISRK